MLRLASFVALIVCVASLGTGKAQTPAGLLPTSIIHMVTAFNDSGWNIVYQENFDTDFEAIDGQTFGEEGWLIFQLLNGGAITVANGYAQLNAPDFWNAALIRSTDILRGEYKIRTKIGFINYDLTNYEQDDYDNPDFNDHDGYYENGMYFLTLTDRTCSGNECAENWWHYHRKMVIDVDNHLNSDGGETFHPVFMVYMAPEENSGGNLLRTWDGTQWDTSPWNWNVAYTYDYDTWYYAELEKSDYHIILRLYDADQNIIEETTPVSLDLVNAMDDTLEYLYLGEPHTDDYEGDVRLDEITLLVPQGADAVDDNEIRDPKRSIYSKNYPNPFNATTVISFILEEGSDIRLDIYDLLGRHVETLFEGTKEAGVYSVNWNAANFPSGIYFARLETAESTKNIKMVLLK